MCEYGDTSIDQAESSCFCELKGEDLDGDMYKILEIDGMPQETCKNLKSGETEILSNNLIIEGNKLRLPSNNDWDVLLVSNFLSRFLLRECLTF